jgi:hypothetical protein
MLRSYRRLIPLVPAHRRQAAPATPISSGNQSCLICRKVSRSNLTRPSGRRKNSPLGPRTGRVTVVGARNRLDERQSRTPTISSVIVRGLCTSTLTIIQQGIRILNNLPMQLSLVIFCGNSVRCPSIRRRLSSFGSGLPLNKSAATIWSSCAGHRDLFVRAANTLPVGK